MGWSLLVVTPARSFSAELAAGRPVMVGRSKSASIEVADDSVAERHLSLTLRGEGLMLEVVRGAASVLVNDLPVQGQAVLRPGDEVRLGAVQLFPFWVAASSAVSLRLASFDEVMRRLEEELLRAALKRPVGVVAVAASSLNVAARQALARRIVDEGARGGIVATWGQLAPDVLLGVLPEAEQGGLHTVFERLTRAAGARASVATALSPLDGVEAEALVGRLWAGLFPPREPQEEPAWSDPYMVRLAGLFDAEWLLRSAQPVCVRGPPGSGRSTLLKALARNAGVEVRTLRSVDEAAREAELARPEGWLLVRDFDLLPAAVSEALVGRAKGRLLMTVGARSPARNSDFVFDVPPLRARPKDIAALAEAFLSRARRLFLRPRLVLGADARDLLCRWHWPGNVRELENVLLRAARTSVRDEVGADALPDRLTESKGGSDLRRAVQAAERDLLLEALARTRWNVTQAAVRLGVPRRTVVYRLRKLGLRRPSRL